MEITKDISIEELIVKMPDAIKYLSSSGIRCVICGEPIWGTLESAARDKGFGDEDIARFVADLNDMAARVQKL
jgi:hypothetical protein